MDLVLVMHDVDAFDDQVSAYPAITLISNRPQGAAVAADTTRAFGAPEAIDFATWYAACYVTSSAEDPKPVELVNSLDWRHFSAAINARLTYLKELGLPS
ncbi:hypothetical protein [Actinorugispora endophytica]|nr:hypothetical protein [Actinorugispora endophytica]